MAWLVGFLAYTQGWLKPSPAMGSVGGFPRSWFDPPVFILATLFFHYLLKFAVAGHACRAFATDRRSGMLELLLTTPLSEDEIIRGRLLAIKRLFLVPTLVVLAIIIFVINNLGLSAWASGKLRDDFRTAATR